MTDFEKIISMLEKADIGYKIVPRAYGFSIEANNSSFGEKISFDFDKEKNLSDLYS